MPSPYFLRGLISIIRSRVRNLHLERIEAIVILLMVFTDIGSSELTKSIAVYQNHDIEDRTLVVAFLKCLILINKVELI